MAKEKQLTVEQFNALSKAEQKVLIAQDVIVQIKRKKYELLTGVYIKDVTDKDEYMGQLRYKDKYSGKSLQKVIPAIKSCTVCALGACVLSTNKFKNVLTVEDIGAKNDDFSNATDDLLKSIFTVDEIGKIESLFEGCASDNYINYANSRLGWQFPENDKLYTEFQKKYPEDTERLIMIMSQIIKDNGKVILKNFKNL